MAFLKLELVSVAYLIVWLPLLREIFGNMCISNIATFRQLLSNGIDLT